MITNTTVRFFDTQFQRQVQGVDLRLNPFEEAALPYLHGRVLDFGCGLGNLALAAARNGCSVLALDASPAAIEHLGRMARSESLPIQAVEADLRSYQLDEDFDAVVSIGLLMFFDCEAARRQLAQLQARVRPGGIAVVNVLVEGTTYADMFDPSGHCLLAREELCRRFAAWQVLHCDFQDFPAPNQTLKCFGTVIASKPVAAA